VKSFMIRRLAVAVFLGLNTPADALQDDQAKPTLPDQSQSAQPRYQAEPTSTHRAVLPPLRLTQTEPDNLKQAWTIRGNALSWFDLSDRTTGMTLTPADDALRAHLNLPKDQGLLVTALDVHAPAALAGIQQNDVLIQLGEVSLAKSDDLEQSLKGAGDKPASLTILRGGKKLKIQVQPQVRVTMGPVQPEPPPFWIGVTVSSLGPALTSQLKLPQNQGLLAIDIVKDSPAAKAEVKVHDILLSLAGKVLDSQEKLVELVQANGEKSVPLELIREGKTQTIEVTPLRRKPTRINVNVNDPRVFSFRSVLPGVVLPDSGLSGNGGYHIRELGGGGGGGTMWQLQDPNSKQSQDAGAGASKRLDELDAEIKQLRRAIEELTKTLKDKK
jgi:serine protease Do